MHEITSSALNSQSAWDRLCDFLRAFDESLHREETSALAARLTKIERQLADLKEQHSEGLDRSKHS